MIPHRLRVWRVAHSAATLISCQGVLPASGACRRNCGYPGQRRAWVTVRRTLTGAGLLGTGS